MSVFWLIYLIGAVLSGIASFAVYAHAAYIMRNEAERGVMPLVLIMLIFLSALWPAAIAVLVAVCIISTMQEKE